MLWTAPPPARERHGFGRCYASHDSEELPMQTVTTIGLDIAKSVFQVHGVDAAGQVVIRRKLNATFWRFSRSCRLVWPCPEKSRPMSRRCFRLAANGRDASIGRDQRKLPLERL